MGPLSQITNIKLMSTELLTTPTCPSKLLDQRVISTLTGTGSINPRMLNGIMKVHTVSTPLRLMCQLRVLELIPHLIQLSDLSFQNQLLLSNLTSWKPMTKSGLNFLTAPEPVTKLFLLLTLLTPLLPPAKLDQPCENDRKKSKNKVK